ncbi:hypothetical protein [Actinobacillus suis]|nr:hypothetical protein [Actinobacillus suis]SNV35459.1 extracellular matrix protein adhesin A [Actinobacillus suis]
MYVNKKMSKTIIALALSSLYTTSMANELTTATVTADNLNKVIQIII